MSMSHEDLEKLKKDEEKKKQEERDAINLAMARITAEINDKTNKFLRETIDKATGKPVNLLDHLRDHPSGAALSVTSSEEGLNKLLKDGVYHLESAHERNYILHTDEGGRGRCYPVPGADRIDAAFSNFDEVWGNVIDVLSLSHHGCTSIEIDLSDERQSDKEFIKELDRLMDLVASRGLAVEFSPATLKRLKNLKPRPEDHATAEEVMDSTLGLEREDKKEKDVYMDLTYFNGKMEAINLRHKLNPERAAGKNEMLLAGLKKHDKDRITVPPITPPATIKDELKKITDAKVAIPTTTEGKVEEIAKNVKAISERMEKLEAAHKEISARYAFLEDMHDKKKIKDYEVKDILAKGGVEHWKEALAEMKKEYEDLKLQKEAWKDQLDHGVYEKGKAADPTTGTLATLDVKYTDHMKDLEAKKAAGTTLSSAEAKTLSSLTEAHKTLKGMDGKLGGLDTDKKIKVGSDEKIIKSITSLSTELDKLSKGVEKAAGPKLKK